MSTMSVVIALAVTAIVATPAAALPIPATSTPGGFPGILSAQRTIAFANNFIDSPTAREAFLTGAAVERTTAVARIDEIVRDATELELDLNRTVARRWTAIGPSDRDNAVDNILARDTLDSITELTADGRRAWWIEQADALDDAGETQAASIARRIMAEAAAAESHLNLDDPMRDWLGPVARVSLIDLLLDLPRENRPVPGAAGESDPPAWFAIAENYGIERSRLAADFARGVIDMRTNVHATMMSTVDPEADPRNAWRKEHHALRTVVVGLARLNLVTIETLLKTLPDSRREEFRRDVDRAIAGDVFAIDADSIENAGGEEMRAAFERERRRVTDEVIAIHMRRTERRIRLPFLNLLDSESRAPGANMIAVRRRQLAAARTTLQGDAAGAAPVDRANVSKRDAPPIARIRVVTTPLDVAGVRTPTAAEVFNVTGEQVVRLVSIGGRRRDWPDTVADAFADARPTLDGDAIEDARAAEKAIAVHFDRDVVDRLENAWTRLNLDLSPPLDFNPETDDAASLFDRLRVNTLAIEQLFRLFDGDERGASSWATLLEGSVDRVAIRQVRLDVATILEQSGIAWRQRDAVAELLQALESERLSAYRDLLDRRLAMRAELLRAMTMQQDGQFDIPTSIQDDALAIATRLDLIAETVRARLEAILAALERDEAIIVDLRCRHALRPVHYEDQLALYDAFRRLWRDTGDREETLPAQTSGTPVGASSPGHAMVDERCRARAGVGTIPATIVATRCCDGKHPSAAPRPGPGSPSPACCPAVRRGDEIGPELISSSPLRTYPPRKSAGGASRRASGAKCPIPGRLHDCAVAA